MVLLVRWMGHSADPVAAGTAKDLGLKLVRLQFSDAARVAEALGVKAPKKKRPKLTVVKTPKGRQMWTAGEALALCRLRAQGESWDSIAETFNQPRLRLMKYHHGLSKKYGGATVLHATLESFVVSEGGMGSSMRAFSFYYKAIEAAPPPEPAPAPPVVVPLPAVEPVEEGANDEVEAAEVEEALAMAVKHSERADKAEAALKASQAEAKVLKDQRNTAIKGGEAEVAALKATIAALESTAVVPGKLQADLKVALALLAEARSAPPERVQKALAFGWRMGSSGATLVAAEALLSVDPDTLAAAMAFHNSEEGS
tara:strand:- start:3701 stop:4639 length:939 start_codon:yes stop_codon:yes gene_type:complete